MDMTGTQKIAASREKVYAALNDIDVLKQCIPGCETIEKLSDTQMRATVTLKIGPVKASFKGMITLSDIDAPNGYTITGEGSGGGAGFAKGGAHVSLIPDGDATLLQYTAKADVGGKLAQLGGRLIDGTAHKLAGDFFVKFGSVVGEPQAVTEMSPTEGAATTAGGLSKLFAALNALFKSWFGKIFGSSVASLLAICLSGQVSCLGGLPHTASAMVRPFTCVQFFSAEHPISKREASCESVLIRL